MAKSGTFWLSSSKIRWLLCAVFLLTASLLWLNSARPAKAVLTQTANGGTINVNDGPATPYPAQVTISGLLGRVSGVTVSLNNFQHARPNDVDVLLVAPTGQTMLLMSDVGGNNLVAGINLTFDDTAPGIILGTGMASGTYKPSNLDFADSFPPAYPSGPFGSSFGVFDGIDPNGSWSLYVIDDVSGAVGVIDSWSITITTTTADLEILQPLTAAPNPAFAGGALAYTINVRNNGGDPAKNAVITLTLPANTSFNGISAPPGWSCTPGATVSCIISSLATGATATFSLQVTVDPATLEGTILTLGVAVDTTSFDPDSTNDTATLDVPVVRVADLQITSYAGSPNPVTPGQNVTFNLRLTQLGPTPASNVTLTIPVPTQSSLSGFTPPPGWSCSTGATIVCTIPNLLTGSVTDFQYVVTVSPIASGVLTSTATVSSITTDSVPANNSATATVIIGQAVDLVITGSAVPNPVTPGQTLTLNFAVSNNGPDVAANSVFSTNTPPNTTFQSFIAPAGWNCTFPAVGGTGAISCTAPTVAVGGPYGFALNLLVTPATPNGTYPVSASVQSNPTPDTNPANNTTNFSYIVGPAADLRSTGTVTPSSIVTGETALYTINIANLGPTAANNVTFNFPLPGAVKLVLFTPPAGWTCLAPAVGTTGTISCTVANFPVSSVVLLVQVEPATSRPQVTSATATISSGLPDPDLSQNTLTLLLEIGLPSESRESADLIAQLRFVPDRTASTELTNLLTYSFTIKNVGQTSARGVSVRFPIPPGTAVGYAEFYDKRVWVAAVLTNELFILLPDIEREQIISGTLVFRPSRQAVIGEKVQLRYIAKFSDPARSGKEQLSNAVAFQWGTQNYTVSDGSIQLMELAFKEKQATFQATFFIPNEILTIWLTDSTGKSVALTTLRERADSLGNFAFTFAATSLVPGSYTVATYGARSEVTGAAFFVVEENASKVIMRALPAGQLTCQALKICGLTGLQNLQK